jgi:glycosyltransferase involved in cell wall biosynthesis
MKVVLSSYQAVSILHGGVNTQIRKTTEGLRQLGIDAELFDQWGSIDARSCDLFHIIPANIGTYHLAREICVLGIPLIISPVTFSLHSSRFIRTVLAGTRLLQKTGRGIWSDYAIMEDMCSWSSGVLPNTRAEAALVSRSYHVPREKIHVIPNGVDERFLHGDPSLFTKQYGLENFLLTVGHTGHERKNVLRLIKALADVDHPAVIIGRIIDSAYGRACVNEAAKHKHILLLDGLDNTSEMLASAYAACDTFVLPSLFETPGIAALEAALAGAKIVITPHGGAREYFGGMAEYVDPYSVESIRDGVRRMLEKKKDPLLKEHIREEFLWPRIAEKTASVYRTILSGSGR